MIDGQSTQPTDVCQEKAKAKRVQAHSPSFLDAQVANEPTTEKGIPLATDKHTHTTTTRPSRSSQDPTSFGLSESSRRGQQTSPISSAYREDDSPVTTTLRWFPVSRTLSHTLTLPHTLIHFADFFMCAPHLPLDSLGLQLAAKVGHSCLNVGDTQPAHPLFSTLSPKLGLVPFRKAPLGLCWLAPHFPNPPFSFRC